MSALQAGDYAEGCGAGGGGGGGSEESGAGTEGEAVAAVEYYAWAGISVEAIE